MRSSLVNSVEGESLLVYLAREMRDLIYEHALVANAPISVLNFADPSQGLLPPQLLNISPALLAICKALHEEAASVLYASDTFQAVFALDVRRAQEWHQVLRPCNPCICPPTLSLQTRPQLSTSTNPGIHK